MTEGGRPGGGSVAGSREDRGELPFAAIVTTLFAVLLAVALARHEMWRDELQAWMLARDSGSLAELYANTRYEGHAGLWFLVLWAVSRITRSPVALQVVHGFVATATVFLVSWRAPFPRRWRALIPFGYFFVYDYAVLSRPYALGILLLVAWCALRARRPEAVVAASVLLALLANTSAYGVLLAGAAAASMIVAVVRGAGWREPMLRRALWRGAALLGLGVLTAAWWMVPPRNYIARAAALSDSGRPDPVIVRAGLTPLRSFLPVQSIAGFPRIWQSNVLLHEGGLRRRQALAAIGVALLAGGLVLVRHRREAVAFFGAFALAYLAFESWVYPGALYHHGHLLVALVAALWLAGRVRGPERVAVDALLVVQVVAGSLMLAADARAPFSGARDAAAFLRRSGRADGVIIGAPSAPASSVAAYLDHPLIYPDRRTTGTFMVWSDPQIVPPDSVEAPTLREAARRVREAGGRPVTVLLAHSVAEQPTDVVLTLLAGFAKDVITGEPFYVYAATPPSGAAAHAIHDAATPTAGSESSAVPR
jgi:hypothetical protein